MENLVMRDVLSLFSGKRVLLTGDTGFKGSWLALWLRELGAEVVGYALPPEGDNSLFNLLALKDAIHHVDGDIRDLPSLQHVVEGFQPQFIFHLAAQALVRRSYEEPKLTLDTNIGGAVNILEVVRASQSLRVLIFVTSDKCYRNREWVWGYRENDEMGGHDPYSASKASAELIFSSYFDSYLGNHGRLGLASVRGGNAIGGGDRSKDRIIPDVVTALEGHNPIVLRNPYAVRPWQHVIQLLSGYLILAVKLYDLPKDYSGGWNFGPNGESVRTVHDLVKEVIARWGEGSIFIQKPEDDVYEDNCVYLNCDKAERLLGWSPKWNFERTLKETVYWYKNVVSPESCKTITKQQIIDYMATDNLND